MNEDTQINFDSLIVGQLEIKQKWQRVLDEIETRRALGKPDKLDKLAAAEAKQNIKLAEEAITELNKSRSELVNAIKNEEQASSIAEEKEIIKSLVDKYYIGYLLSEGRYMYCRDVAVPGTNIVNPIFQTVEAHKFGRVLNKMSGQRLRLGTRVLADELADYFQDYRKDYTMTTCSFNRSKWSNKEVYNKADVIMNFWIEPDFENMENYDKRFDFLMRTVGGGKAENIEHLEKWIGYKRLNPDRVANTPNLDIGGYPGGNGKGRIVELCKTIFTNPCVSAATLDELTKFNASWEMSILLYYDEPEQNELPEGKLKNATGSEDIRIEKKGIDATMADRNYSIMFLSNNPNGVVKLAGTGSSGEDRRYSVMTTNLVMVDEAIKMGFAKTIDEAKVFVNSVNDLIKNRSEVAKWLAHIIMKHNIAEIEVLQPLHGVDYHSRFDDQKSAIDIAFDHLKPVFLKNEIMPYEILKACVVALTGWEKLSDKTLKQDWKRYLEKNKIANEYHDGHSKIYFDYEFNGKNTKRVQKAAYTLTNTSKDKFDLSTVMKRSPASMERIKESLDSRDLLVFEEN